MKKILLPLLMLAAISAGAQVQGSASEVPVKREGTITYERTIQMRRPQNMPEEMAARFPPSRTDVFELLFGNGQSLWRVVPTASDEGGMGGGPGGPGGPGMMIRQMGNNEEIFYNSATGQRIDKRELFDNEFVVTDSVRRLPWKMAEETKMLLGHLARKATAQRIGTRMSMSMENGQMKRTSVADTSTIVAWFTTEIPAAVGPEGYQGQLPGAILEMNVNNGRIVFRALQINPKVSLSAIREPKGKHYTQAEFEKERDRLMEEMRKNAPPGMQMRMQAD